MKVLNLVEVGAKAQREKEGAAFKQLLDRKECKLLPLMSKTLGSEHGLTSKHNALMMPLHVIAMNVAKHHGMSLTGTKSKNVIFIVSGFCDSGNQSQKDYIWEKLKPCMEKQGMCATAEVRIKFHVAASVAHLKDSMTFFSQCGKSKCASDCNTRQLTTSECKKDCSGMCGVGCSCCWDWICGDCCWHQVLESRKF